MNLMVLTLVGIIVKSLTASYVFTNDIVNALNYNIMIWNN